MTNVTVVCTLPTFVSEDDNCLLKGCSWGGLCNPNLLDVKLSDCDLDLGTVLEA